MTDWLCCRYCVGEDNGSGEKNANTSIYGRLSALSDNSFERCLIYYGFSFVFYVARKIYESLVFSPFCFLHLSQQAGHKILITGTEE